MTLAEFVKSTREARGLNKAELAAIAGISPSYLGRIEDGKYKTTSVETLERLSRALKVSFDEIRAIAIPKDKQKVVVYDVRPKSPSEIVRELTNSLPEMIPVYARIGDKKAVEYAFLPQPTPTYRGKDMKLEGVKAVFKYRDIFKPGDIIVVAKDLPPEAGDLCVKNTGEICAAGEGGLPVITIIRYVKKLG